MLPPLHLHAAHTALSRTALMGEAHCPHTGDLLGHALGHIPVLPQCNGPSNVTQDKSLYSVLLVL